MSDQFKHSPINIPIVSGDDDPDDDVSDVIEIDGDDLIYDPDDLLVSESNNVESDADASEEIPAPRTLVTESLDPYVPPPSPAEELNAGDAAIAEAGDADERSDAVAEDPYDADEVSVETIEDAVRDDGDADEDAPAVAAGEETTSVSKQAVIDLMQELRQKTDAITKLSDERSDLYDKLLRKQAEFENFRKRGEREMQEAYVRARADLLTDLLPVLDNFDLAVQHADTTNPDAVREGVHLIHKQLFDSLFRLGLEPIEADGQPFDPELHEAVATEPTDEAPDHTVLVVLQRGYRLGDRMLRPARVKVAVTP
jgi:molecular chaperone GrpE